VTSVARTASTSQPTTGTCFWVNGNAHSALKPNWRAHRTLTYLTLHASSGQTPANRTVHTHAHKHTPPGPIQHTPAPRNRLLLLAHAHTCECEDERRRDTNNPHTSCATLLLPVHDDAASPHNTDTQPGTTAPPRYLHTQTATLSWPPQHPTNQPTHAHTPAHPTPPA
jgi:hypothetical protein